jgi:DNA-binding IclR family transcriptional regulator
VIALNATMKAVLKAVAREGGTAYLGALPGLTGLSSTVTTAHADTLTEAGYFKRNGQRLTLTADGKRAAGGR